MIDGIRDYIDARVKEVDPNLDAWTEDAFGNNDVVAREAQFHYNFVM